MTLLGGSGLAVTLTGVDGVVWDLLDPLSPVWLGSGIDGLHMPDVTVQSSQYARVPGRRFRGKAYEPRTVSMTINVGDQMVTPPRIGQAWRDLDAAFWAGLPIASEETATLQIGDRFLAVRLEDAPMVYAKDPAIRGLAKYGVELVADDPFFLGAPVVGSFVFDPSTSQDYYGGLGGGGLGPPFYISPSNVFDQATVSNVGDVPACGVWTITGPGNVTVGIGGQLVALPFTLPALSQVIIDTDPLHQSITDGFGNNLWPSMGGSTVDFAPIPVGDPVPLSISVSGAGIGTAVTFTFTPRFLRAW